MRKLARQTVQVRQNAYEEKWRADQQICRIRISYVLKVGHPRRCDKNHGRKRAGNYLRVGP